MFIQKLYQVFAFIGFLIILSACRDGSSAPANVAPVSNSASFALDEDTILSDVLTGSDSDEDPITFSISVNPQNGQISINTNGSFSYTPNGNFNGSDSFQFQVSDGTANSIASTVSLTVNPINDAPIAGNSIFSHDEDTLLTEALDATDVDGDTLTTTIINAPVNGMLTQVNGIDFEYTPVADYFGTDEFTFEVSDGVLKSGVQTVSIEIISVNDAPRITLPDNMSFNESDIFDVDITVIDIDGTIARESYISDLSGVSRAAMSLESGLDFRFYAFSRLSDTDYVYSLFAIDNENARTDVTFTFTVLAGSDFDNDNVTDFRDYDDDSDGYSDFYESLLGSNPLDKTSIPTQTPLVAGVDFTADVDSDTISNAQELETNHDPLDSNFYPGFTLDLPEKLVSFSAMDNLNPNLLAIAPVQGQYDFTTAAQPIEFAYTLADSQNNISQAILQVYTESGQLYQNDLTLPYTDLVIGSTFKIDSAISQYFANGLVSANICAIDTLGNGLSPFGGIDLNCPNPTQFIQLNTTNIVGNAQANIDLSDPILTQFDLPTTLNLDTGDTDISIPVTAEDSGIGIDTIGIVLRPKNWLNLQADEFISVNKNYSASASLADTLIITDISPYIRDGVWQVDTVIIKDLLGNALGFGILDGVSDLDAQGFNSEILITNSQSDFTKPVYGTLTTTTPKVNLNDPNPVISLNITGSDSDSGISKLNIEYAYDDTNLPPDEIANVVYIPSEEVILSPAQKTLDYTHISQVIPQNTSLGTHFIGVVLVDQAGNFAQDPDALFFSVEIVRE